VYKTILVSEDIEKGRRLLPSLEKILKITAAFWFHYDEQERWKLVVVSPDVSEKGPRALYTGILALLRDLQNDPQTPLQFSFDDITLVSPASLLYKRVKQGSGLHVGPVPEGPSSQDAYIYKMA
jgi:hypothetical protein